MAIHGDVHDTESMEYYFPQHTRPESSYTMQYEGYMETEEEPNEVYDRIIGALRECLEEIDIKGKELLNKIVSKGDVEIPLGRLAREAIGESQAKDLLEKITKRLRNKMKGLNHDDFVVEERGVSLDEELKQKLERFKVKTVNIGGIVKDGKQ